MKIVIALTLMLSALLSACAAGKTDEEKVSCPLVRGERMETPKECIRSLLRERDGRPEPEQEALPLPPAHPDGVVLGNFPQQMAAPQEGRQFHLTVKGQNVEYVEYNYVLPLSAPSSPPSQQQALPLLPSFNDADHRVERRIKNGVPSYSNRAGQEEDDGDGTPGS